MTFICLDFTCLDTCMRDMVPGAMERQHLWTRLPATKDMSQLILRWWSKWQEWNISQQIDHQFSAQIFTKKKCTSDTWCFWYFIFKYCKTLQNFNRLLKEYRNFDKKMSHLWIILSNVGGLCSLMWCCADPGSHYHYLSMSSLITLLVSAKSYLLRGESLSKYPFYLHLSS